MIRIFDSFLIGIWTYTICFLGNPISKSAWWSYHSLRTSYFLFIHRLIKVFPDFLVLPQNVLSAFLPAHLQRIYPNLNPIQYFVAWLHFSHRSEHLCCIVSSLARHHRDVCFRAVFVTKEDIFWQSHQAFSAHLSECEHNAHTTKLPQTTNVWFFTL